MILLRQSNILLRIFCFMGIAPSSQKVTTKNSKISTYFIPFVSSIISLCLTIFLLFYPHFESLGPIHTIINFSSLMSLFLTNFTANFQSIYYKSVYHKAIYRIRQMENKCDEKRFAKYVIPLECRYNIKVLVIFILYTLSQSLVLIEVMLTSGFNGMGSSIVTSLLRILFPLAVLHVVLLSDIITMFMQHINQQVQNSHRCLQSKVEFLKNIKLMHLDLSKLVAQINVFFGWNLLFLIIKSFIYILYQLYWIFLALQLKWDLFALFGKSVHRFAIRNLLSILLFKTEQLRYHMEWPVYIF